ncbi:hypothetical protein V6N11_021834 [Hibiscus sabdariffa]|uniref:Uncharacterized protein n=1 Tax=Hibiscus sabdariffa TaxID=183260 RepID=A0ABR2THF1_9ROSI
MKSSVSSSVITLFQTLHDLKTRSTFFSPRMANLTGCRRCNMTLRLLHVSEQTLPSRKPKKSVYLLRNLHSPNELRYHQLILALCKHTSYENVILIPSPNRNVTSQLRLGWAASCNLPNDPIMLQL